jgi:hypothetical protein
MGRLRWAFYIAPWSVPACSAGWLVWQPKSVILVGVS